MLPINLFIRCRANFLLAVFEFINKCFLTGGFQICLISAFVIPIFKSGDRNLPASYGPIFILSYVSKVLEKCIRNRINRFLIKHTFISTTQFGYETKESAIDVILKLFKSFRMETTQNSTQCNFL